MFMFEQLLQALNSKGLLSERDLSLLSALDIRSDAQFYSVLIAYLKDKEFIVALCSAIGRSRYTSIKLNTEALIPGLIRVLEHSDWEIRLAAVEAIGLIDAWTESERVYNIALHDNSPEVRSVACDAIGLWRNPKAVPTLSVIVADVNQPLNVRERAIEALGITSEKSPHILLELLKDPLPAIRYTTLVALHNINDVSSVPFVEPLLEDNTVIKSGLSIGDEARSLLAHLRSKRM